MYENTNLVYIAPIYKDVNLVHACIPQYQTDWFSLYLHIYTFLNFMHFTNRQGMKN